MSGTQTKTNLQARERLFDGALHRVGAAGNKGLGLFAARLIKQGEVIDTFRPFVSTNQIQNAEFMTMPWSTGCWLAMHKQLSNPLYYLNHSCVPSAWLTEDGYDLVSRKDIGQGQEITVDYATFEHEEQAEFSWNCLCKELTCRGQITGKDLAQINPEFMDHATLYLRQRHDNE